MASAQLNDYVSPLDADLPAIPHGLPPNSHGDSSPGVDHSHPSSGSFILESNNLHSDILAMHRRRVPVFEIMARYPRLHSFIKATLQFRWTYDRCCAVTAVGLLHTVAAVLGHLTDLLRSFTSSC